VRADTEWEGRRGLAVTFRAIQGAGGRSCSRRQLPSWCSLRSALSWPGVGALFGIAGGLTAIGPLTGGYLLQWTWRAIFWINIPIALIALILIAISRPATEYRPDRMDYRGLALIVGALA